MKGKFENMLHSANAHIRHNPMMPYVGVAALFCVIGSRTIPDLLRFFMLIIIGTICFISAWSVFSFSTQTVRKALICIFCLGVVLGGLYGIQTELSGGKTDSILDMFSVEIFGQREKLGRFSNNETGSSWITYGFPQTNPEEVERIIEWCENDKGFEVEMCYDMEQMEVYYSVWEPKKQKLNLIYPEFVDESSTFTVVIVED